MKTVGWISSLLANGGCSESVLVDPVWVVSAEEFGFEAGGSWESLWLPELMNNLARTLLRRLILW